MAKFNYSNGLSQELLYDDLRKGSGTTSTPTPDPYDAWYQNAMAQLDALGGPGGAGNIGAYTNQAKNLLGEMDLSGFDRLRQAYEQSYGTNKEGLETSYEQLLANLQKQGTENKQQFGQARGTIMEDSFTRNRDLYRNLASRGLGASGLQQLGGLQNRMETGRQVNTQANQFYKTSENIADTQSRGTDQFNQQLQTLSDSKNSAMAGVEQQEIQYKNAYQQQLASLATQLQQTAAAASANAYQAKLGALQAKLEMGKEKIGYDMSKSGSETEKMQIASMPTSEFEKVTAWMDKFGVDRKTAQSEVKIYGNKIVSSLKQEVFAGLDKLAKPELGVSKNKQVFQKLKEAYDSGTMEYDEIADYVQKKFGDSPAFYKEFPGFGAIPNPFDNSPEHYTNLWLKSFGIKR